MFTLIEAHEARPLKLYVYNTETDHKIDSRAAGRYLSYRVTIPDTKDFEFSGFDFEVTATGRR